MNRKIIRNSTGRHRPLSEDGDTPMCHGGIVSEQGPFGGDDDKAERAAQRFSDSIESGMSALENGTSPYAADVEPVPGAAIEYFDIFDVEGKHHMIWRVACRERKAFAN